MPPNNSYLEETIETFYQHLKKGQGFSLSTDPEINPQERHKISSRVSDGRFGQERSSGQWCITCGLWGDI